MVYPMSSSHSTPPAAAPAWESAATADVVASTELEAAGIARSTIARRCRRGGPWRRVLPGVVLLTDTEPTREQLLHAAVCQLGTAAVITGTDALRVHGIRAAPSSAVHVLVPVSRRLLPSEHTTPERTSRLPHPVRVHGLPFAPLSRAVIDAARHERDRVRLHMLLRTVLICGAATADELREELDAGNQRGTADVRTELARATDSPYQSSLGSFDSMSRT